MKQQRLTWLDKTRHNLVHFLGQGGHDHGGGNHGHGDSSSIWATPVMMLIIFNCLWPLACSQTPGLPLEALYIVDVLAVLIFLIVLFRKWKTRDER